MPAMKDIKGPKQPQSARRMWHLLKRRWSPILTMQILGVHSGPPLWLRCVDLLEVKANLTCSAKMANTNRRFSPHICAVLLHVSEAALHVCRVREKWPIARDLQECKCKFAAASQAIHHTIVQQVFGLFGNQGKEAVKNIFSFASVHQLGHGCKEKPRSERMPFVVGQQLDIFVFTF